MYRAQRLLTAAAVGLVVIALSGCNPSGERAETTAFNGYTGGTATCTTTGEGNVTSGGRTYRQYQGYCGENGAKTYLFTSHYSFHGVPQPSGQPVDGADVWFDRNLPHPGPDGDCFGATLSKDASGTWTIGPMAVC